MNKYSIIYKTMFCEFCFVGEKKYFKSVRDLYQFESRQFRYVH